MNGIPSRSLGLPTRIALGHNILAAAHSINRWVCCYFYLKAPACLIFYSHRLLFQVSQDRGSFSTNPTRSHNLPSFNTRSWQPFPALSRNTPLKTITPVRLPTQPFPALPANASGSRRITIPRNRKNLLRVCSVTQSPVPALPKIHSHRLLFQVPQDRGSFSHRSYSLAQSSKLQRSFLASALPSATTQHIIKTNQPPRSPT